MKIFNFDSIKRRQSTLIQCALLLLFIGVFGNTFAQNNPKELRQKGDVFFEKNKYHRALTYYQEYNQVKKNDNEALLRFGICLYYTHRINQAQQVFTYLVTDSKKVNPDTYLYGAKCAHAQLDFDVAVKLYKQFLGNIKETNSKRSSVRDAIRRCENGLKIAANEKPALVENLGETVNSIYDEFAPVLSPNYDDKLYFASARSSSKGGLRNAEGRRDDTFGAYSSDMYFTTINNGAWSETTPMNALLNTPRNDMILDFNTDGSVLFFYKGYNGYSGEILVDTFSQNKAQLYPSTFKSSLIAENGDGRLDIFNDSLVLFDSRRAGGFGGRDLYFMVRQKDGSWSAAQNLGANINSAYDETTPFLAADGKTLYFSSNDCRKSIGGMDILVTQFDYDTQTWSIPKNIGLPINSAGDDLYFSLSKDGLQGYFSSNRMESLGQSDLFVAYFKQKQGAQLLDDQFPYAFSNLLLSNNTKDTSTLFTELLPSDKPLPKYKIESLYYTDDSDVLNNTNIARLDNLAQLLKKHPQTSAILICHTDNTELPQFELYFGVKRAEQAAQYLIKNGVTAQQISIRSVGSQYPIAQNNTDNQANTMGQQLNRRIDIAVQPSDTFELEQLEPKVSAFLQTGMQNSFRSKNQGVAYRIQVAELKQMYKGKLIHEQENPAVERQMDSDLFFYTVGWFKTYQTALDELTKLNLAGHTDVFIIPYVDGHRVSKVEVLNLEAKYPDLRNFIGN